MPRIIENVETKILDEGRKQVHTNGYSKTTVRSVVASCGISIVFFTIILIRRIK